MWPYNIKIKGVNITIKKSDIEVVMIIIIAYICLVPINMLMYNHSNI